MSLSRSDIAAIRAIFREELAARARSGAPSTTESGALVEGENQCRNENERNESMDPTNTDDDGELSLPAQMAARLLNRARRTRRPKPLPLLPVAKSKDGR